MFHTPGTEMLVRISNRNYPDYFDVQIEERYPTGESWDTATIYCKDRSDAEEMVRIISIRGAHAFHGEYVAYMGCDYYGNDALVWMQLKVWDQTDPDPIFTALASKDDISIARAIEFHNN